MKKKESGRSNVGWTTFWQGAPSLRLGCQQQCQEGTIVVDENDTFGDDEAVRYDRIVPREYRNGGYGVENFSELALLFAASLHSSSENATIDCE